MAWNQHKSCADAEGNDSASDGDLDIAYALLLADKQWGSCGAIDYLAEAANVLADIEAGEVDTSGSYVLLGDWVDPGDAQYYHVDALVGLHARSPARASPPRRRRRCGPSVLDHTYTVFDGLQTTHSPATGLLPDFIANPLGTPAPVAPGFLEGPNDGAYDYNACRDPWRLGTDFLVSGDARAKTAVQRITTWIRAATGDDPGNIRAATSSTARSSAGADYRSMAFVAPLGVGAMVDARNQAWLNAVWDLVVATPIDDEGYYENTLKLLVDDRHVGQLVGAAGGLGRLRPAAGTPLCTGGGALGNVKLKIAGLNSAPGDQSVSLNASLFFPAGIPVASPYVAGAQLLHRGSRQRQRVGLRAEPLHHAGAGAGRRHLRGGRGVGREPQPVSQPLRRARSAGLHRRDRERPQPDPLQAARHLRRRPAAQGARRDDRRAGRPAARSPGCSARTQAASDGGECAISPAIACTSNGSGSVRKCQ